MSEKLLGEERTDKLQKYYFGERAGQVEGRLLGYHNTIYGGGICDGGIEDMWKAVRRDHAALACLAEVYAERKKVEPQVIQRRGMRWIKRAARKVLCNSGRLPAEVHERFARRFPSTYRSDREMLILEDF